jgi:response regulator RpfG family c-di-GMP phosphodiesterase
MNDSLIFAEEFEDADSAPLKNWKVLIIDDEPEIHQVTRLVVSDFVFAGKGLDLVSAYSAQEAKEILKNEGDDAFALAIVDVVMETNNAGLELVQWVRQELNNHNIRLVLRTGQPGEAPEENVIRDYDLNDYKNKTELTALKLKTLFYSALRGYRDILIIERHRYGLEKIIEATSEFIECETLPQFASAILKQVAVVLGIEPHSIVCCAVTKDHNAINSKLNILASNKRSNSSITNNDISYLPSEIVERLESCLKEKHSISTDDYFIGYFTTKRGTDNLLYVSHLDKVEPVQHSLLEFFANNIAVAYENLSLRNLIMESQRELSYVIGEAVEMRSKETGSHVKRVANISYLLGILSGMEEQDAEMLRLASPLHDVGKVGIPDSILNKPGKLDEQEWQIMQGHAQIGFEILAKSQNPILQQGAIIAQQHHEKWDGSGYPKGLLGKDIHIIGRITAVADVFDALGSKRCYKNAWTDEDIVNLMRSERGKHFDPNLIDLMLANIDDFFAIRTTYPDDTMQTVVHN